MLIVHAGRQPKIHPTSWVAPDATIAGDVAIGPECRVLWGARIIGEGGGKIRIGRAAIVMENAVIRATARQDCTIGDHCLVGPQAHVVGALLEDEVFVATGAAVFHGARLGRGAEVRVHATVHLRTRLAPGAMVPIGWVAVGDPARILPPDRHEAIWAVQKPLDFPGFVYGVARETPEPMRRITERLAATLGEHRADRAAEG
jgi:carbonic anhydrase/acetyltransferase-like protein (isoleucine patch superfamily)